MRAMSSTYLQELFGFEGRMAVVIGGTGVLGGTLCEGLAQAGAHVIVAGRNAERGQARVAAIEKLHGNAAFIPVDSAERLSVETLLASVLEQYGRVDAVVNCAGVNSSTPYFEITDEEFRRVIDTNVLSTHISCQVFGRHMKDAGGGSILNIGSITSDRPLSRVFIYSASKAAVLSLTRNVARELAPHHVRVNCLCPGFFPAEQNRKILDKSRVEAILGHTPIGRLGEPHELIGAALLLLSPRAGSFITGEALYVDGGFNAMTI
jgi:NAD(P)-dependent dehydrogenase (short-subunit alcohol dehydrogenase family)